MHMHAKKTYGENPTDNNIIQGTLKKELLDNASPYVSL